jgi:hypothetical protein
MRVALYARVSTERQEQQGTIASQLDAIRGFARDQQHDIVDDYVCVDEGYSGTRLDRPGLDRLRDGAEAGAFEAAVILCPDRLAHIIRSQFPDVVIPEVSITELASASSFWSSLPATTRTRACSPRSKARSPNMSA